MARSSLDIRKNVDSKFRLEADSSKMFNLSCESADFLIIFHADPVALHITIIANQWNRYEHTSLQGEPRY